MCHQFAVSPAPTDRQTGTYASSLPSPAPHSAVSRSTVCCLPLHSLPSPAPQSAVSRCTVWQFNRYYDSSGNVLLATRTPLKMQIHWQLLTDITVYHCAFPFSQAVHHTFLAFPWKAIVSFKCIRWRRERREELHVRRKVRGAAGGVGVRWRCRLLRLGSAPFCVSAASCASLETQSLSSGRITMSNALPSYATWERSRHFTA